MTGHATPDRVQIPWLWIARKFGVRFAIRSFASREFRRGYHEGTRS